MNPTPQYWNGVLRWACPVCPYDAADQASVQSHITVKHPGAELPSTVDMELSTVPVPLPGGPYPKISCVMVTRNRQQFARQAAALFAAQTYPNKELVVIDDSDDELELPNVTDDVLLRYQWHSSLGAKRNTACRIATGEFIAIWDDDEWHSPNRLALQYAEFNEGVDLVGIARPIFGVLATKELFIFNGQPTSSAWCSGSTIMFRKSLLERHRFPDVNVGEDQAFIQGVPQRRVKQMSYPGFNVSFVHGSNTVTKHVTVPPYVKLSAAFPIID